MNAGFGTSSQGSFARFSLLTSSWKTLEPSLVGDLKLYSGTWPKAGTLLNGIASRQSTWEPPTVAADFSSSLVHKKPWATPASSDSIGTSGGGQTRSLRKDVRDWKNWPTPRASVQEHRTLKRPPSHNEGHGKILSAEATEFMERLYPTPAARDWRAPNSRSHLTSGKKGQEHLGQLNNFAAHKFRTSHLTKANGEGGEQSSRRSPDLLPRLNPEFMEWLMGLPIGWSDSMQPETEWYPWLRLSRSLLSGIASQGSLSREQLGFEALEEE